MVRGYSEYSIRWLFHFGQTQRIGAARLLKWRPGQSFLRERGRIAVNTAMTACARDKSGDAGQQNCAVRDRCASHSYDQVEVEDETVVDAEHCRSQRIADRAPVPTAQRGNRRSGTD